MWVYEPCNDGLTTFYTVGFYGPDGNWNTDSDCETREQAAKRVHYLNGGRAASAEDA